ncbi:hypothetical protein JNK13_04520 [bacterium]|nr:hypothetical protein [bacterium]
MREDKSQSKQARERQALACLIKNGLLSKLLGPWVTIPSNRELIICGQESDLRGPQVYFVSYEKWRISLYLRPVWDEATNELSFRVDLRPNYGEEIEEGYAYVERDGQRMCITHGTKPGWRSRARKWHWPLHCVENAAAESAA